MIKISKTQLKEKFEKYLELGLTNGEIAERLNEEFNAEGASRLNSIKVGKLKKAVGLAGAKPKAKQLFELVDDEEYEDQFVSQVEELENYPENSIPDYEQPTEQATEQPTSYQSY
jgi:hypothetical protein